MTAVSTIAKGSPAAVPGARVIPPTDHSRESEHRPPFLDASHQLFEWDVSNDRIECWNADVPELQIECYDLRQWFDDVHPEDCLAYDAVMGQAVLRGEPGWLLEYRARGPRGRWRLYREAVRLRRNGNGRIERIVGSLEDVTELQTTERLLVGQQAVLERIASAAPLTEVLDRVVRLIEFEIPEMVGSILLRDFEQNCLRHGAGPNLSEEYVASIDRLPIGLEIGSCGAAVASGQPIISRELATDSRWAAYLPLVEPYGFRACWSHPILDAAGVAVGTFGMYFREPREPSPREWELIRCASRLAAIAIFSHRDATALRDRERHFRLLADHMTDMVSLHQVDGQLLYVSPSVQKHLGFAVDLAEKVATLALIHPEDIPTVLRVRSKHILGEQTVHVWRCLNADNQYVWVETTTQPVRDETGQFRTKVCVTRNIEDRKRFENAIIDSEAKLRELAEAIPGIVYSLELQADGSRRWNFLSRRATTMFGLHDVSADEWAAFLWSHLVPEDAQRMRRLMKRARRAALPVDIELRMQFAQEELRWYRNFARPVPAADGSVTWYGVALDITEQKRAEQERRVREEQLEAAQRLESLGVLAGGIAHDFNNLLTPVIAFAELARGTVRDPVATARSLDRIEEAARQAVDLCRQMLLYAGRGHSRLAPINLRDVILQLRLLFQHSVSKSAQVTWELADDLPPIHADAGQVRQVVMNLLLNASEALIEGIGTIVIRTQLANATDVRPEGLVSHGELRNGEPYAVLSVSDNGAGMTPETALRVFEPFFSTKFVGRGLGLAAVLGIIRGHEGAIALTTEPERGTTFSVYLPLAATDRATSPQSTKTSRLGVSGRRVLVIDDEVVVRRSAQQLLESLGIDSCAAADDVTALKMLQTSSIDGVLLDLTMPGLDGLEFAERLRSVSPGLPIILMSGYSPDEIGERYRDGSFSAFLPKPFSRREMAETLQRVLN